MPKLIQDEFSALNVSAQRRYQLRKNKAGCCRICGAPGTPYCRNHAVMQKDYARGRIGFSTRSKQEAEVI